MQNLTDFVPLFAIALIFYFFILAPQLRRSKKEKKFAANLKKGDRVITKSGMHGKIAAINDKDNSCVVETLAGKIKFERSALSIEMTQKLNTQPKK
ncbi:MAG: preprotein translocase subunit YajC [Formosa sp.]|jgi:preprotein translocase subunit YajC|nr:preprotein translocase subunit YajC [Formosa sp.]|tara:strand:- start:2623 stop:2910 length:288 start_codon:yes stop_codon:yes gene_type:complete